MNNNYYFLLASPTYSGLSTMAAQIVDAAKKTYDGNVMNEVALNQMIDTLKASAEEMKRQNPRWRVPRIELVTTAYSDSVHVCIDKWSFLGYKVKDIVGYVG